MTEWRIKEVLKSDSFGRVECLEGPNELLIRRVACGGRIPGSGFLARKMMARERRALEALVGLPGVPALPDTPIYAGVASDRDGTLRNKEVLVRTWLAGVPLHLTSNLAEDFFDHLDMLVESIHDHGVCHNDLHKEQNILVGEDGFPYLIDFQLASIHAHRGALYRSRVRDDFRHIQKHRKRYTRDGRGPQGASAEQGRGYGIRRSTVALLWRRTAKPLYNIITRRLLKTRDGEMRRPSTGPWPTWSPARGPRRN